MTTIARRLWRFVTGTRRIQLGAPPKMTDPLVVQTAVMVCRLFHAEGSAKASERALLSWLVGAMTKDQRSEMCYLVSRLPLFTRDHGSLPDTQRDAE